MCFTSPDLPAVLKSRIPSPPCSTTCLLQAAQLLHAELRHALGGLSAGGAGHLQ